MTTRHSAPPRVLTFANRSSFRASLLSRASLAAVLAGTAAAPRAVAGGTHLGLQQALASASAAAARVTGNAASISAGQQAAIGIANLQTAVKTMQQALARQTSATGTASTAFNGIGSNALQAASACEVASGACTESAATALAMIQGPSNAGGTVTVTQTAPEAVINWSSFNVGAKTHLVFNQSAGGAADTSWSVLNRITGSTSPSEIFGSITAPGQVLILNPNGVLFGNGAQVNLHSLVAGAISIGNAQYISSGIYGTFTLNAKVEADSGVTVQPGAVITTPAPENASDGGGSVLLIAGTVDNGGTIETPAGQTILSGGGTFTLRTGFSVPANTTITPGACTGRAQCSTVLGTEIDAAGAGAAINTGYIFATTGDITLDARNVTQGGILYATTSVSRRGTIHLLSETTDTKSSITLAPGSLTYIAPDPNSLTADNAQRDDTPRVAYGNTGAYADQAYTTDYPDRSRIEITTGGVVNVETNALVLANGGQVAISTAPNGSTAPTQGRVFMATGANIDVSGLNNIIEPMSANVFSVNIQGVTLADAPVNREAESLFSNTISLDARRVITVAPSTVDPNARDYTAGGLLEVSGELAQIEQSIAEWSAIGGNVTIHSGAVVAQPGSVVNIAGGTIVYQAGSVPQTYLIGPGGVLYNANIAPANLLYSGVYDGDVIVHKRWHTTDTYRSGLLTPASIQDPAYIEGRDAGTLTLATPTALFEATINAGVQTGPYQTAAHSTAESAGSYTDPVSINQNVAPQAGSLVFADMYSPADVISTAFQTNVTIAAQTPSIAGSLTASSKIASALVNTAVFGATQLDGLGGLTIVTGTDNAQKINVGSIDVNAAVTLAPGGTVTLAAPAVTLDAALTARSGSVTLETTDPILTSDVFPGKDRGSLIVTASGSIDTRGLWTNLFLNPADSSGAAFVNGGNVSLISTGRLSLAAGSVIDASAGAVAASATSIAGGKGGNITLVADDPALLDVKSASDSSANPLAPAIIDGTVRSLGVSAGGTFSLTVPSIAIGNGLTPSSDLQAVLSPGFLLGGFSAYILNGFYTPTGALGAAGTAQGVVVEPGTSITVAEPVLEATPTALLSPSGTDPSVPLTPVLNPEFVLNPATGSFSRRAGASLTLDSTGFFANPENGSGITISRGATMTVDTGQSVTLESPSQITVLGTIAAPSGTISVLNTASDIDVNPVAFAKLSIWIGATSVLDAAGEAVTGATASGERVGEVFGGGSILIGASGSPTNLSSFDSFSAYGGAYIFVRPGAELEASGASAELDLAAGTYDSAQAPAGQTASATLTNVASAGGTIAFSSDFGIYLDNGQQGILTAASGGAGAAGGELIIRLGDPGYTANGTVGKPTPWANWAYTPHQIIVSNDTTATQLPAALAPGDGGFVTSGANGQSAISQQQITTGGFGSVFLEALDQITFNGPVTLKAPQSITLADFTTSETSKSAAVAIVAPYVLLAGSDSGPLGYATSLTSAHSSPLLEYNNSTGADTGQTNSGQPYTQKSPCVSGLSDCYNASLTVNASLIDLVGNVETGGAYARFFVYQNKSGSNVYGATLNTYGFSTTNLNSSSDIRFIPAFYTASSGFNPYGSYVGEDELGSEGNVNLTASRIYPATEVDAEIFAGLNYWGNKDGDQHDYAPSKLYYGASIAICSSTPCDSTATAQPAPLSVFGTIDFNAVSIIQDGNVFAPLGKIDFGAESNNVPHHGITGFFQALSVSLGKDSTTSVSANGLILPFGGTTDGTTYNFDASAVTFGSSVVLGTASLAGNLAKIAFDASQTTVAAGATLDLEGGGTLTGGTGEIALTPSGGTTTLQSQGFISGRGGSTDTLVTPFVTFNAKTLVATQPSLAQDPIFAIVPSYENTYAPISPLETSSTTTATNSAVGTAVSYYGSLPQIGEQVTIGKSVDGLAAGTYTLLPSYYALLPGAYRVQIVASSVGGTAPALTGTTLSLGNGTFETSGNLGASMSGVYNTTPSTIYLTSAATIRTYSQYDEENYSTFGTENAAVSVFGNPRSFLPEDAGAILVTLSDTLSDKTVVSNGNTTYLPLSETGSGFNFSSGSTANLAPAAGGYSGVLEILSQNSDNNQSAVEVLGPTSARPSAGAVGISASAIDNVGAPIVFFGSPRGSEAPTVLTVDSGATLAASALFLIGSTAVNVDAGATLTTTSGTAALPVSNTGFLFGTLTDAILGLANGNSLLASGASGRATIDIGKCDGSPSCTGLTTTLLSDGVLGFVSGGDLTIGNNIVFGARAIQLDSGTIDIGTPSSTGTSSTGTASTGITLTQALLNKLFAGDPADGIPALETLSLAASNSIDFLVQNPGAPATNLTVPGELDLNTPGLYAQNDVVTVPSSGQTITSSVNATITTGTLVWTGFAGKSKLPPGFGDGTGDLTVQAIDIAIGYPADSQSQNTTTLDNRIFGFNKVSLNASSEFTANNHGSLSVYQCVAAACPTSSTGSAAISLGGSLVYSATGGTLDFAAPLVTTASGAILGVTAGGDINLSSTGGTNAATPSLGGEIDLTSGGTMAIDTQIGLESGKFMANAGGDISLGSGAMLDLSGPTVKFFTQSRGSFGGTAELISQAGNINEAAGATIDIAATDNNAGTLTAIAPAGTVSLAGALAAGAPAGFDAGSVAITVSSFGTTFQSLTGLLSADGATFAQTFEQLGAGNLSIGNITAQNVSVSVDDGSLTETGTIDAQGPHPGSIDLAATGNLTLAPGAVLNVQETTLGTDQLGELIDAENQSHIELQVAANTQSLGMLTISNGVTIEMGAAGTLQNALTQAGIGGDLEIDAPRNAFNTNVNVSASSTSIAISGATTVAVNAFKTYIEGSSSVTTTVSSTKTTTTIACDTVTTCGTLTQNDLNAINTESQAFITGAVSNGSLTGDVAAELAGLDTGAIAAAFHLRPGVEIDSATSGSLSNLTIAKSLDFSGYRYATVNSSVPSNAVGGGEPGVLWLRVSGNLDIDGSISDGFEPALNPPKIDGVNFSDAWALWPMLDAGDLSWSFRLVAGADMASADSSAILSAQVDGSPASLGMGNLTFKDIRVLVNDFNTGRFGMLVDVVRTGTGYLDLAAGGDFVEGSPYGIYTAGTQPQGAASVNVPASSEGDGKYVTTDGGNVSLVVGGSAQGFVTDFATTSPSGTVSSNSVSDWLGYGALSAGYSGYYIDFGRLIGGEKIDAPILVAFTGIGALGGGDLTAVIGADAGNLSARGAGTIAGVYATGGGLDFAVASTAYRSSGVTAVFGGGDITLAIGRSLNPETYNNFSFGDYADSGYGDFIDLRGTISVLAGSIGQITLSYGQPGNDVDPRPVNPYVSENSVGTLTNGGPAIVLGDGTASVDTRGDLVFAGVGDGGKKNTSFYEPNSGVHLFSAGGNLVPTKIYDGYQGYENPNVSTYYAPIFDAVAAVGNIYLQTSPNGEAGYDVTLAPSTSGSLDLLAGQSIFDSPSDQNAVPLSIQMSGAASSPASEFPTRIFSTTGSLAQSATGTAYTGGDPTRFYAVNGDIVGLQTGYLTSNGQTATYTAATPVQMIAGGNIVSTGSPTGVTTNTGSLYSFSNGPDLFLNNSPTDISLVEAGKDVIYANIDVAGPGQLLVEAGGNVYQGDEGILLSLGEIGKALTPLTRESGAGITVLAGLNGGFDPTQFAELYLSPANLANTTAPLQDQKGKVERTYQTQLLAWLQARGYTGSAQDALAYFLTLPQFEQTAFLLTVYYAELNQSGLDYNNPASRFYHSYIEGKEAISSLFPNTDATGQSAPDGGNLTLFSGLGPLTGNNSNFYLDSAIRTEFGGAIQTLVPYGQTLLGNYGIVPQATAGILTQGSGDIDMYSYGGVTLGQSRVLTTYGGNVLIWMSSDGEINAGRGSKTTALTPPPDITYDPYGNIFLSPTVPSSGAGIGALAPIAGIPAGDVNLIAPVGTVDAGEAGVRASGNINVAALTVVNAANLSSGGKTTGVPTVAGPSVAATAAASAAAASSQSATQNTLQRPAQQQPSIIEVDVLTGGVESQPEDERKKKHPRA